MAKNETGNVNMGAVIEEITIVMPVNNGPTPELMLEPDELHSALKDLTETDNERNKKLAYTVGRVMVGIAQHRVTQDKEFEEKLEYFIRGTTKDIRDSLCFAVDKLGLDHEAFTEAMAEYKPSSSEFVCPSVKSAKTWREDCDTLTDALMKLEKEMDALKGIDRNAETENSVATDGSVGCQDRC